MHAHDSYTKERNEKLKHLALEASEQTVQDLNLEMKVIRWLNNNNGQSEMSAELRRATQCVMWQLQKLKVFENL